MSTPENSQPGAEPTPPPPAPARRRGAETARSMLISMAIIVALALVLFFLVPRSKGTDPATVDIGPVATQTVARTGWPISAAGSLPDGWKPTNVRFSTVEHRRTWHVGYLTPDKQYVAVDQTKAATSRWVAANTKEGTPAGTRDVAGQPWQQLRSTSGEGHALLLRAGQGQPLTTVVWGTVSYDDLATFAARLEPVRDGSASASDGPSS